VFSLDGIYPTMEEEHADDLRCSGRASAGSRARPAASVLRA